MWGEVVDKTECIVIVVERRGCNKAVSEVVVVFYLSEHCFVVVPEESRNLFIRGRFS